jgi:RNA polymerase-associated protein RTF1
MEDYFEESIRGLYVRVGIGINHKKEPVYRVAEVSEAKQGSREYRFGGRLTRKVIMCHQAGAAKAFPLEVVSNSPFTESEYARYADECRKRNRMPSREDVRSREAALNKMANHHYTPQEVLQIIARKKQEKGVARPVNMALERARLYLERESAATAGDEARLAKADAEIAQLDEWTREDEERGRAKVDMSKINEKNERVNQEVLKQKARARDIREAQEAKGAKVDDLDPFSRRPTAPSVMYIPASQLEQEKAEQKAEEERRKALQKQKLEDAEARKRKARGLDISFDGLADLFDEQPATAPVLASIPLPTAVVPAPAPVIKPVSLPVPPAASPAPGVKALSLDDYKRRRGLA